VAELCVQLQLLGLNARDFLAQGMQLVEDLLSLTAAATAAGTQVTDNTGSCPSAVFTPCDSVTARGAD
jgi:hypothetical protein